MHVGITLLVAIALQPQAPEGGDAFKARSPPGESHVDGVLVFWAYHNNIVNYGVWEHGAKRSQGGAKQCWPWLGERLNDGGLLESTVS